MFKKICTWYFKINGWKILGDLPAEKKYLVIVGPHTSFWDFILAVAVRHLIRRDIKFLAKKELFRFPLKRFFLDLGGYPVDRSKNVKLVDQVIDLFNSKDEFAIAITPEGTRRRVSKWKTGFYHIAKGARIPIYMVGLNYAVKEVVWHEAIYPGESYEKDFKKFVSFFVDKKGKVPEYGIFDDTVA